MAFAHRNMVQNMDQLKELVNNYYSNPHIKDWLLTPTPPSSKDLDISLFNLSTRQCSIATEKDQEIKIGSQSVFIPTFVGDQYALYCNYGSFPPLNNKSLEGKLITRKGVMNFSTTRQAEVCEVSHFENGYCSIAIATNDEYGLQRVCVWTFHEIPQDIFVFKTTEKDCSLLLETPPCHFCTVAHRICDCSLEMRYRWLEKVSPKPLGSFSNWMTCYGSRKTRNVNTYKVKGNSLILHKSALKMSREMKKVDAWDYVTSTYLSSCDQFKMNLKTDSYNPFLDAPKIEPFVVNSFLKNYNPKQACPVSSSNFQVTIKNICDQNYSEIDTTNIGNEQLVQTKSALQNAFFEMHSDFGFPKAKAEEIFSDEEKIDMNIESRPTGPLNFTIEPDHSIEMVTLIPTSNTKDENDYLNLTGRYSQEALKNVQFIFNNNISSGNNHQNLKNLAHDHNKTNTNIYPKHLGSQNKHAFSEVLQVYENHKSSNGNHDLRTGIYHGNIYDSLSNNTKKNTYTKNVTMPTMTAASVIRTEINSAPSSENHTMESHPLPSSENHTMESHPLPSSSYNDAFSGGYRSSAVIAASLAAFSLKKDRHDEVSPTMENDEPHFVPERRKVEAHLDTMLGDTKAPPDENDDDADTDSKRIQCSVCGNFSSNKSNLRRHMRLMHDEEKLHFQCTFCPQGFRSKMDLHFHEKATHQEDDKFVCPECPSSFQTKTNLTKHIRIVHEKVTKYNCTICHRSYYQKSDLIRHLKTKSHIERVPNDSPENYI